MVIVTHERKLNVTIALQCKWLGCVLIQDVGVSVIMSKRITIMIDDDLDKKIRLRQAKLIQQEQSSYSYSRVVNDTLRKSLN